jgi:hypothetical protein
MSHKKSTLDIGIWNQDELATVKWKILLVKSENINKSK